MGGSKRFEDLPKFPPGCGRIIPTNADNHNAACVWAFGPGAGETKATHAYMLTVALGFCPPIQGLE